MRRIAVLWLLAGIWAPLSAAALEPSADRSVEIKGWPYLRPEFRRLMDAVTLHVSFDRETLAPDMAEGEKSAPAMIAGPPGPGQPQFADGVVGRALVLGSGAAIYPRFGNVLLEKRGALALWVRPENWQRPRDGNCVFAMTTNSTFYLQRQGPDVDDEGRIRRHEAIQYLVFLSDRVRAGLYDDPPWQNGRWYLLVANWSWPTLELSVDGAPFKVTSLAAVPSQSVFGDLVLGNRSDSLRGLLDEVMAFRRPLTAEETKLLESLRPK